MGETKNGFLVLADISGFTAFVTETELEHGPPMIAALLEKIIERISPPLAAGRDVILAHRLLKNRFARGENYTLLTRSALENMSVDPAAAGLLPHDESYEHFGQVECFILVSEPSGNSPAATPGADIGSARC